VVRLYGKITDKLNFFMIANLHVCTVKNNNFERILKKKTEF